MTKRQAMQKVRELAQTARKELIADCEKMIDSGMAGLSEHDDNYALPKILITAALTRGSDMFSPASEVFAKEVRNLLKV